jgi:hypothetical protein
MKYLKLFEQVEELYKEVIWAEWNDFMSLHEREDTYKTTIIYIIKKALGYIDITEHTDFYFSIHPVFIYYQHYTGVLLEINQTDVCLFKDEYITIRLEVMRGGTKYFIIDGRDGLVQFLEQNIIKK